MMSYSVLAVILLVVPVSVVLAVDPHPHCTPGDCGEGEKKGTDGRCFPCDSETYMEFKNHSCKTCYPCDSATLEEEILVNCTNRRNALVKCKTGYFNAYGNKTNGKLLNASLSRNHKQPKHAGVDVMSCKEYANPDSRICLKCNECSDNEYVLRNCTESQNTLCIPNTTTSKAVPDDDETTNVRNDLSTSETANTVNETTVSPASNFSTTAPPEAGGDSSTQVLIIVFSVIVALAAVVIAALGIYKCWSRFCRNTSYHLPEDTTDQNL